MNFDGMEELSGQQKEFIEVLNNEKQIFLIQLDQIFKEQREALDQLHKNIIRQVDHIEDSLNLNIISTIQNSQEDKYKGFVVQTGKRFK